MKKDINNYYSVTKAKLKLLFELNLHIVFHTLVQGLSYIITRFKCEFMYFSTMKMSVFIMTPCLQSPALFN